VTVRLPLPPLVKEKLRPTTQWLAISLPPAEQVVAVELVASGGTFDVTSNIAVAAMRPFTLRLSLDSTLAEALSGAPAPLLRLVDRELGRTVGLMWLKHTDTWETAGARIGLFEVESTVHHCVSWPRRVWDSWMYERAVRNVPRESLLMTPTAVEHMLAFYLRPRPVFLVSVDDGEQSNIFPMDLVGPLPPDHFTLALRTTSPSVETIKRARKVAMADLPGTACRIAYQLGAHHKRSQIDWESLPFKIARTREFGLPFPEIALRVREVEILDFKIIGSHCLFVGRIRSETVLGEDVADGERAMLCHTSGANQLLRTRYKRPFREALTPEPT
jgi:flavin reductase (DIM6/NTAB) family NADH-FMN oxidoreductase RutF